MPVKASLRDPESLKEAFTDQCSVAISVMKGTFPSPHERKVPFTTRLASSWAAESPSVAKATFTTFNVAEVAFATPEVGV
ncbi:hypothetical protein [Amycolatopsis azurea]|uniref:hypothetical protein n=1 Tax=Amycolatopsis azurea TaxID=36819 RepID=UPI000587BF73|nr:hypothetical protein [Amycolatopsis azurea]